METRDSAGSAHRSWTSGSGWPLLTLLVATLAGYLCWVLWADLAPLLTAVVAAAMAWMARRPQLDQSALLHWSEAQARGEETALPEDLSSTSAALGRLLKAQMRRHQGQREAMIASATVLRQLAESLQPSTQAVDAFLRGDSEHVLRSLDVLTATRRQLETLRGHLDEYQRLAENSQSSALQLDTTNTAVGAHVHQLAESVDETAASIEEMTYSIKEVARNIEDLSLAAEQTATSMNQMDTSISEVESNVQITTQLADEVARDAGKGAEAVQRTLDGIDKIRVTVTTASSVIAGLGERIREIGNILGVIEEVAEQTNLLALNAAIIAAQAGEHGRGFAVVAEEIKELSEKTGASTKEISALIKAIQDESRNAVEAIAVGERNVHAGVELSREAEDALAKILDSSAKSTQRFKTIASATAEQARGSKIVADAVERIARSVQQVAAATAEQARGSEQLMRSAERIKAITHQVERASHEQGIGSKQILEFIESLSRHRQTMEQHEQGMREALTEIHAQLRGMSSHSGAEEGPLELLRDAVPKLRGEADRLASRGAAQLSSLSS